MRFFGIERLFKGWNIWRIYIFCTGTIDYVIIKSSSNRAVKGESDVDNPLGASPDTALIVRKRVLLAGYLIVILYFMFFGFGRIERFDSYQFSLVLNGIPLWLPKHFSMDLLKIWFFALGNVVAFIPFGVLIPANLPASKNCFGNRLYSL